LVVAGISEIAKPSSLFGALVASLPLTSLLAFLWLYLDHMRMCHPLKYSVNYDAAKKEYSISLDNLMQHQKPFLRKRRK
jgi:hypothetical protein